METVLEFIMDLIFDGIFEISKCKKVNKYIRYPLILIILLCFLSVFIFLFLCTLLLLKQHRLVGIAVLILFLFLTVGFIIQVKNIYFKKKQ